MGFVLATSQCVGCKKIFSYNPKHVPSIRLNNNREPICQDCINIVNPKRVKNGLDPIVPHPEAYTACDENELE